MRVLERTGPIAEPPALVQFGIVKELRFDSDVRRRAKFTREALITVRQRPQVFARDTLSRCCIGLVGGEQVIAIRPGHGWNAIVRA